MNDTAADVACRYRELLLARPGPDRLRMACETFDCAREMMIARIEVEQPGITDTELRVAIFLRTYRSDFSDSERDRIIASIRARSSRASPAASGGTNAAAPSASAPRTN